MAGKNRSNYSGRQHQSQQQHGKQRGGSKTTTTTAADAATSNRADNRGWNNKEENGNSYENEPSHNQHDSDHESDILDETNDEFSFRTYGYIVSFQRDHFGFISWRRIKGEGDIFFADYVESNLEPEELVEFEAFWNASRNMWNGRGVRRARMSRGEYVRKGVVRALGANGEMREFPFDEDSLQRDGFYNRDLLSGKVAPGTPVVFFLERDMNGDERVRLLCVVESGEVKKFYTQKNCGFLLWSQSKSEDNQSDPFFWCSYSGVEAMRRFVNSNIPFKFAAVVTERGRPQALHCHAEGLGTVSEVSVKEDYLEIAWSPQNEGASNPPSSVLNPPLLIRVERDDIPREIDFNGIRKGDRIRFDYYFARAIVIVRELIVPGIADGFPGQRALKVHIDAAPSVVSYSEDHIEGEFEILTGDKLRITLLCLPEEMCDRVVIRNIKPVNIAKNDKRRGRKKATPIAPDVVVAAAAAAKEDYIVEQQQQQQQHQQSRNHQQKKLQGQSLSSASQQSKSLISQHQQQQAHGTFDHSMIGRSSSSLSQSMDGSSAYQNLLSSVEEMGRSSSALSTMSSSSATLLESGPSYGMDALSRSSNVNTIPFDALSIHSQQSPSIYADTSRIKDFLQEDRDFNSNIISQLAMRQSGGLSSIGSTAGSNALLQLSGGQVLTQRNNINNSNNNMISDIEALLQSPQSIGDNSKNRPHGQNNAHNIQNGIQSLGSDGGPVEEAVIDKDLTLYRIELADDGFTKTYKGRFVDRSGVATAVSVRCVSPEHIVMDLFVREMRRLVGPEGKSNAHMVQIKDVKSFDQIYIVMECDEYRLTEVVSRLSAQQKLNLIGDLMDAVAYYHDRQLVHCDIKPSNIVLTSDLRPKLIDDSIARCAAAGKQMRYSGTLNWSPKEVITNCEFTTMSDMFSLGLVFFYILSGGKHAFQDPRENSLNSVEENIKNGQPMMLQMEQERIDRLLPGSARLISAMLQTDGTSRPQIDVLRRHPLLWSNMQRVQFLSAMSALWELDNDHTLVNKINSRWKESFGQSWFGHLPDMIKREYFLSSASSVAESRFKGEDQAPERFNTHNCTDLVRFILRVYKHLESSGDRLPFQQQQQQNNGSPRALSTHVESLLQSFPDLVHFIYNHLVEHRRNLSTMLSYANKVMDNLPRRPSSSGLLSAPSSSFAAHSLLGLGNGISGINATSFSAPSSIHGVAGAMQSNGSNSSIGPYVAGSFAMPSSWN